MSSVRRQSFNLVRSLRASVAFVVLGMIVGGLVTAATLVTFSVVVSPAPETMRAGAVVVLACLSVGREVQIVRFSLPQRTVLIPSSRLEWPVPWGSFWFGLELGVGWRTRITTTVPYVLAIDVLLTGNYSIAVVVASGWGLGRSIPVVAAVLSRSERTGMLTHLTNEYFRRLLAVGAAVALAVAAVL